MLFVVAMVVVDGMSMKSVVVGSCCYWRVASGRMVKMFVVLGQKSNGGARAAVVVLIFACTKREAACPPFFKPAWWASERPAGLPLFGLPGHNGGAVPVGLASAIGTRPPALRYPASLGA
jgi:hypothetical protein